jgi:hypothetical protein
VHSLTSITRPESTRKAQSALAKHTAPQRNNPLEAFIYPLGNCIGSQPVVDCLLHHCNMQPAPCYVVQALSTAAQSAQASVPSPSCDDPETIRPPRPNLHDPATNPLHQQWLQLLLSGMAKSPPDIYSCKPLLTPSVTAAPCVFRASEGTRRPGRLYAV